MFGLDFNQMSLSDENGGLMQVKEVFLMESGKNLQKEW